MRRRRRFVKRRVRRISKGVKRKAPSRCGYRM